MAAPAPYPPVRGPDGHRGSPARRHGDGAPGGHGANGGTGGNGGTGARRALFGAGAGLAAVALAAAVVVVVMKRDRSPSGPDPYAGSYPLIAATAMPTGQITWQPSGPPAGPLKRFSGHPSRVVGKVMDTRSGLAYAKLGPPWTPAKGLTHSAGMEWDIRKPKFHWWAGAYSDLLSDDFVPAAKGPNGLRAAAELDAAQWADTYEGKPIQTAGQPLKISGRSAWLAGYRVPTPGSYDHIPERALVVVVVNSGRNVPAVFEVSIAKPKYQLLPDINTLVGSLRVIR